MITALGKLGSGASAFGFSLGRVTEGLSEIAKFGLEKVADVFRFQLETAQKVADTYTELTKTGATFGGSVSAMAQAASSAGIPIQNFAKLIMTNVESLAKFGKSYKEGAVFVGTMGNQILQTNDKLAVMYGGVDGLNQGIAEYIALQSQLGIDETKDRAKAKEGAIEYLMRQKELSQITGKTAETLKKEEEGRRRQLDYNLKLGRLGDVARENLKEGMAVAGKVFNVEGQKYAEEYFATGGRIISKENLYYQAANEQAAAAIAQLVTNVNTTTDEYRRRNAAYFEANAPALEGWARSLEETAVVNRGANNPFLKSQVDTASAIIENLNLIGGGYGEIVKELQKDRTNVVDEVTKGYAAALRQAQDAQVEIDGMVLNNMKTMSTLVKFLYDTQKMFIQNQAISTQIINSMVGGNMEQFVDGLEKLGTALLKRIVPGFDFNPLPPGTEVLPNVRTPKPGEVARPSDENPLLPSNTNRILEDAFKDWLNNLIRNNPTNLPSGNVSMGGPYNPISTAMTMLDSQTVEQHTALLTNLERNTADSKLVLDRILTAVS